MKNIIDYSIIRVKTVTEEWFRVINQFSSMIFHESRTSSWIDFPPLILFAISDSPGLPLFLEEEIEVLFGKGTQSNIIGFKIGSFRSDKLFHSSLGGILPEYRQQGIAKQLQFEVDKILNHRSIELFTFNTYPNKFPEMFLFGIKRGFQLYNVKIHNGEIKVYFRKHLKNMEMEVSRVVDYGVGSPLLNFDSILNLEIIITGWKYSEGSIILLYRILI